MHTTAFKVWYCVGKQLILDEVNVSTMTQSHTGFHHKFYMKSTLAFYTPVEGYDVMSIMQRYIIFYMYYSKLSRKFLDTFKKFIYFYHAIPCNFI